MPDADRTPDLIWADLWDRLRKGRADGKHPFRTGALVTANALGRPDVRTVVLRHVDAVARTLDFQTDRRSPKFSAIHHNGTVAWLFYAPEDQLQLRVHAATTVHTAGDTADTQWAAIPDAGRVGYRTPVAPGSTLDGPDAPPPDACEGDGRAHFAVVRCELTSIEWLKRVDHAWRRLRFAWPTGEVQSTWLMP